MPSHRLPGLVAPLLLAAAVQTALGNDWTDIGFTSPLAPTPGYLNEWLRKDDPYMNSWNVGVLYWGRYESKQNGGFVGPGSLADFRRDVDNDNSYYLQRVVPRIGYTDKWFEVFVQGRSSTATGDDRSSTANGTVNVNTNGVVTSSGPTGRGSSPESDGPIDLNQAYVSIGNHKEFPVSLKLGRQELVLGEQRIVGPLLWNNIGRQWDAAKMRWQNRWFAAEAWSSLVVMPDDNGFNKPNNKEAFSGLQVTTKQLPKLWSEFYLLARNVGRGANSGTRNSTPPPFRPPEAQDVYTAGTYLRNSTNDWQNVDFGVQAYYQFGNFADFREAGGNGPRRDHSAWAVIGSGGYTWKESALTPYLGAEYSYASGDSNPNDGEHNTFVHLYPTGHLFYGFADFASLQNLHNIRLRSAINPTARLKLMLEGHLKWLDSVDDNFYNVAGLPRGGVVYQGAAARGTGYGINPDAGSFVGTEIDLVAQWRMNKFTTIEAAYCHFFRGDYIKDSLAKSGSQDADYVYAQVQIQF